MTLITMYIIYYVLFMMRPPLVFNVIYNNHNIYLILNNNIIVLLLSTLCFPRSFSSLSVLFGILLLLFLMHLDNYNIKKHYFAKRIL